MLWGDAFSLLEQAERLRRQFFRMGAAPEQAWEPPIDVVETADAVHVHVALPGVAPDSITIVHGPEGVAVSAQRPFAAGARGGARILRVEIPYGRFERRIALPADAFELVERVLADGCLRLRFVRRASHAHGAGSQGGTR